MLTLSVRSLLLKPEFDEAAKNCKIGFDAKQATFYNRFTSDKITISYFPAGGV